jgi:YfiH family protein
MTSEDQIRAMLSGESGRVRYEFFTRTGGVSEGLHQSLNCGTGSTDDIDRVMQNRAQAARRLGAAPDHLVTVHQCHTARVEIVERPWPRREAPTADAMATNRPGLALGILTADCAPVLLFDAEAEVVGAAHAGWRGASAGIVEATVETMERLGARRSQINAVVGPTISQEAYEVGEDFRRQLLNRHPYAERFFAWVENQPRPFFDLPGFIMSQLEKAGVQNRTSVGLCTRNHESMFFSYRRSQERNEPDYGRQISAILVL